MFDSSSISLVAISTGKSLVIGRFIRDICPVGVTTLTVAPRIKPSLLSITFSIFPSLQNPRGVFSSCTVTMSPTQTVGSPRLSETNCAFRVILPDIHFSYNFSMSASNNTSINVVFCTILNVKMWQLL